MSLNWDITKIKDHEKICWMVSPEDPENHIMNPITNGLIWATMIIGMGEITESNWQEFYRRVYIYEHTVGSIMLKKGQPSYITVKDVKDHIGLHTNVWPKTSRTKFLQKIESMIDLKEETDATDYKVRD